MDIEWIDLAIIGVIGLSMITGLIRGLVKELVALCIWILAFWIAFHYSSVLDPHLKTYISEPTTRQIASFILLLLGSVLIGGLFNALLSFILKRSGLSGTDRLLGMVFGLARGIFIVSLMMVVVKMTLSESNTIVKKSQLYAHFNPVVAWLGSLMPQVIKQVKAVDSLSPSFVDLTGKIEEA